MQIPVTQVSDVTNATVLANGTVRRTLKVRFSERDINVKDYGAIGNNVHDDTSAIQAAINAANSLGITKVYFPPGRYNISSTLFMFNQIELCGDNDWRGSTPAAGLWAQTAGMTMISLTTNGTSGTQYNAIRCLEIQGGNSNCIGININYSVDCSIEHCLFANFTTGGKGIYGGGSLDMWINFNQFTGAFFGYAMQVGANYANPITNDLYGIAVGTFHYNLISANQGIDFEGVMDFGFNDHEHLMSSLAALYINNINGESFSSVHHSYFEIQFDNTNVNPYKAILTSGNLGSIQECQFFGGPSVISGSIAVDVSASLNGLFTGNFFGVWDTGIKTGTSYTSLFAVFTNQFSTCNTNVAFQSTFALNSSSDMTNPTCPNYLINLSSNGGTGTNVPLGWQMCGPLGLGGVSVNFATTTLNLSKASVYYFNSPTPTTVTSVTNALPSMPFWIISANSNLTLSHTVFQNASATDLNVAANTPVPFLVRPDGQIWQVNPPATAAIAIGASITGASVSGGMLFESNAGTLAQDSQTIQWNATTKRCGLGAAPFNALLDITHNSTQTTRALQITNTSTSPSDLYINSGTTSVQFGAAQGLAYFKDAANDGLFIGQNAKANIVISALANPGNTWIGVGTTGAAQTTLGQLHVLPQASTLNGVVIEQASSQTADLLRFLASDGSTVLSSITSNAARVWPVLADTSAPSPSLYLGSNHLDANNAPKLIRKDASGNINIIG